MTTQQGRLFSNPTFLQILISALLSLRTQMGLANALIIGYMVRKITQFIQQQHDDYDSEQYQTLAELLATGVNPLSDTERQHFAIGFDSITSWGAWIRAQNLAPSIKEHNVFCAGRAAGREADRRLLEKVDPPHMRRGS